MKWAWLAMLGVRAGRLFREIVLLAVFSLSAFGGNVFSAPQMVIDHQFWNFGTITNGAIFSHDYCVSNAGDATLTISNVISTCSVCLHAFIDQTNIPPGTATMLHARLDLRILDGPVTRDILVNGNDPQNPASVLELNGTSIRLYQVEPLAPVLDLTSGPNTTTAQITPSFNLHAPLSHVSCDDTNLQVDITSETGGAFLLTVQAADWVPGDSGVIAMTIRSSDTNDPPCAMGVYVRNPPKMELLPTQLTFQPRAEEQTRVLWLKQHGSSLLTLLDAIPPPGNFHCEIDPDPDGYDYAIYLTASQLPLTPGQVGSLLLKMTDASHQEKDVIVPILVGTP
jgi:hypothetical protein